MKTFYLSILIIILSINLNAQKIIWEKTIPIDINLRALITSVYATQDTGLISCGSYLGGNVGQSFVLKLNKNCEQEWIYNIDTIYRYLEYGDYIVQNKNKAYTFLSVHYNGLTLFNFPGYFFRLDLSDSGDSLNLELNYKQDVYGIPYYLMDDTNCIFGTSRTIASTFLNMTLGKRDSYGNITKLDTIIDTTKIIRGVYSTIKDFNSGYTFLLGDTSGYFYLYKTDINFKEIFRKKINYYSRYKLGNIFQASDSGYIITTNGSANFSYISITKIDNLGNVLWNRQLFGDTLAYINSSYLKNSGIETPEGDYIVIGNTSKLKHGTYEDTTTTQSYIVKLSREGKIIWESKFRPNNSCNRMEFIHYAGNNRYFLIYNVTNMGECVTLLEDTTITNSVSEPQNTNTRISIFPNPACDILYINGNINNYPIKIYSIEGIKQIDTQFTNEIDISKLSTGVYYIQIGTEFIKFVK